MLRSLSLPRGRTTCSAHVPGRVLDACWGRLSVAGSVIFGRTIRLPGAGRSIAHHANTSRDGPDLREHFECYRRSAVSRQRSSARPTSAGRVKGFYPRVEAINALEDDIARLSDDELRMRTADFRHQLQEGASLDDLLVPAFATVREAAKRALGQRHFDVQLIGGMVLHEGKIAEMKYRRRQGRWSPRCPSTSTPSPARACTSSPSTTTWRSATPTGWGQVYKFLGLTVGTIVHGLDDEQRKASYACDVTYGTNNELGFDYLRDNMKMDNSEMVQRGHSFAIVDEVDSILIDEARTPAHHLRSPRGQGRSLRRRRRDHAGTWCRRLRARREAAAGIAHRGRQRARRGDAGRQGPDEEARSTTSRTSRSSTTSTRR